MRALLAVPLIFALRDGREREALLILFIALLTDGLDGMAARRWNAVSETGKVLDPVADKIVMGAAAFSLWAWYGLPGWFLFAVIARDAFILFGGALVMKSRGAVPSSNLPGKITLNVLGAVLLVWLIPIRPLFSYALAAGIAALILSLLLYARLLLRTPADGR